MVNYETNQGNVSIKSNVYMSLAGDAATKCFGVKGMCIRSIKDGLVHLLKREAQSKGVKIVYLDDKSITIELHIIVSYGVNIPVVADSIIKEVSYKVESVTGTKVKRVDVFVDSMMND